MKDHPFLFEAKKWLGEGKIQVSMSEEELAFYTRWEADDKNKEGKIPAVQEVQINGVPEMMLNRFLISGFNGSAFTIELENASLGKIEGKGVIKEGLIAWEFRNEEMGFEGFEFYEAQNDGTYLMRAEYATPDQFRTVIRGTIWEKLEAE